MNFNNGSSVVVKNTYLNSLVAAVGGKIFICDPFGNVTTAGNQATPFFSSTNPISMAYLNLAVYCTDGSTLALLNLSTLDMQPYGSTWANSALSATAGLATATIPTTAGLVPGQYVTVTGASNAIFDGIVEIENILSSTQYTYTNTALINFSGSATGASTSNLAGTPPTFCSQVANWRGRLVLFCDQNNPQNFYMARTGSPTDWNYAATDESAAIAGNLSASGQIGEPLVAFVPWSDDYAMFSCINQLWMLEGDPAAGGTTALVSDRMGLLGPNAWTTDPEHVLYFVGTEGLYSFKPMWEAYLPPQLLTGNSYDQYFVNLDRNSNRISLVYDGERKYIHLYAEPVTAASTDVQSGQHLIFDVRNGGLWPISYAGPIGPTYAASFPPGAPGVKEIVALGGLDGNVHRVDPNATDDEGTAISSFLTFAAINPVVDGEAVLARMELDMGEVPSQYPSSAISDTLITDGIGTTYYGFPNTGLTPSTANSTTTTFTTEQQVNATNFVAAYWFSPTFHSYTDAGVPAFSGYNTITLPHAVIYNPSHGLSTGGYVIEYNEIVPVQSFSCNLNVVSGPTAADVDGDGYSYPSFDATGQPVTNYKNFNRQLTLDRRQAHVLSRLGGAWFGVTLSNSTDNTTWSFERAILSFTAMGKNRYQR